MANSTTSRAVALESQILREGYGPGAWHGPDFKAALADVTANLAMRRPAAERHNIAEIALHHAYTIRSVRGQISGDRLQPFILKGEDWFTVDDERVVSWNKIRAAVESEHEQLTRVVADIEAGRKRSALADDDRFNLVVGITCHAAYHAGQVQLIKRLAL